MPDAPFVSGSDILQYHGDANLATGSGQVAYNTNPNDTHPLADLNTTLGKLQDYDAQMQVLKYHQKIKDQEDLAAMLANTGGSAFNMAGSGASAGKNMSFTPLPDDKKILDDKADEIRKMAINNPSGDKYDATILKAQQEYRDLVNHASQRSVFYSQNNAEAAQQNDPDERQAILDNNKQEVNGYSLTDYHTPVPHLNKLTFDPNNFISADQLKNKDLQNEYYSTSQPDAQGNQIAYTKSGLNDNTIDFRAKITPGSKLFPEAMNMTKSFLQSPLAQNPQAIQAMNDNIDLINQERGYAPGSPHFIPKFATVVQGQNGPQVQITNTNPSDVSYALMAEKYGKLTPKEEVKKTALDIQKENEDIANTRSQIKDRQIKNAQEWARQAETKREFDNPQDKDKGKPTTEQLKEDLDREAAVNIYHQVQGAMDTTRAQKVNFVNPGAWKAGGIDPSKYDIYQIPDNTANKFVGVQAEDKKEVTKDGVTTTTYERKGSSVQPLGSYVIVDKATGEKKLAYIHPGREGKTREIAVVPERDAVVNGIKDDAKWDPKQYENRVAVVDRVYGGAPAAQVSQQQSAAPEDTRQIGAKTYVKRNGKWYEQ